MLGGAFVAPVEGGFGAGAACEFPLGLGRQPGGFTGLGGQLVAERDRVLPRHALDGELRRVHALDLGRAAALGSEPAGILAHELLKLFLRHLVLAEVEVPGDLDLVLGLPLEAALLVGRRAHQELAGANADQFHLDAAAQVEGEALVVAGGLGRGPVRLRGGGDGGQCGEGQGEKGDGACREGHW